MRDAAQLWDLFWMLTRTEFRMRDQGTTLGFLWTLLHPLLHFAILYVLFTHWMGPLVAHYPAYLLIGLVQWNFFSSATQAGQSSLRRKAGLISNFAFPHVLIVLSSVFSVLLSHIAELLLLALALVWMGFSPNGAWLALPLLVILELALAVAMSLLLGAASVELRDVERAWGIALYALFFLTPVFYSASVVSGAGKTLLAANPLAIVVEATRAALLGSPAPPAAMLSYAAIISVGLCAASLSLYPRLSRDVAEKI